MVFLTFVVRLKKKSRKNLKQEKSPDRGSNPGPLGERQRCYLLTTEVVKVFLELILSTVKFREGRLFGIVVSTSDCHPTGPGFVSRLQTTLEIFLEV